MPTWTTEARVERLLTDEELALLVTKGIPIADLVTDASAIAEAELGTLYWPFPDALAGEEDPPPILTPVYIQDMVALKAASIGRITLGVLSEIHPDTDQAGPTYESMYRAKIQMLHLGEYPLLVHVLEEAMTFGVDPLGDNEYELNPGDQDLSGFEVIPESARIDGFRYGREFYVSFLESTRGWVLTRLTTDIVDTDEVSYDFTWSRGREKATTIRFDSAEMIPS